MSAIQAEHYRGIVIRRADFPCAEKSELIDAILDRIADNAKIEIPREAVEEEAAILMQGYTAQRRYQGLAAGRYLDVFLELNGKREELMEQFRLQANAELRAEQVIRGIIEAEHITVTREELEAEADAVAVRQNATREQVRSFLGEDLAPLRRDVLEKKARELVYDSAVIR